MNQGNPVTTLSSGGHVIDHSGKNAIFHDIGLFVEDDGSFQSLLIAFRIQLIPTDDQGNPLPDAHLILEDDVE